LGLLRLNTPFAPELPLGAPRKPAGAACRYIDNGNTVSDLNTLLIWEKKDGSGGGQNLNNPQDVDNTYTWSVTRSATDAAPDGTAFTDFLGKLNNCTSSDGTLVAGGFAGRCNWRLPTIAELHNIVDCDFSPCIDPIFGPTFASGYWASTSNAGSPTSASIVFFHFDVVGLGDKNGTLHVRAVRGGR